MKSKTIIKVVKQVAILGVSMSVSTVVTQVIKSAMPDTLSKFQKAQVLVGTFVVADVIANSVVEAWIKPVADASEALVDASGAIKEAFKKGVSEAEGTTVYEGRNDNMTELEFGEEFAKATNPQLVIEKDDENTEE